MFGSRANPEVRFRAAANDRLFSVDFEDTSVAAGATTNVAITAGAGEYLWVSCFLVSGEGNQEGEGLIEIFRDDAATGGGPMTPASRSLGGPAFATIAPGSLALSGVTLSGEESLVFHKKFIYEHGESVCPFKVNPGSTLVLRVTNNESSAQDLDIHLNFAVDTGAVA